MTRGKIEDLLSLLQRSSPSENVFNPWRDVDRENDLGPRTPWIRTRQLRHYLETRLKTARYLLIGEAIGYQGGHFSGIAMTSERILLGYLEGVGICPHDVLPGLGPQRTSRPEIMPKGFAEPTATIVWGTLLRAGLKPGDFVLWNAFPWHPFDAKKGMLSNRRPNGIELGYGSPPLERLLRLLPGRIIIAIGKIAAGAIAKKGMDAYTVRHPANAGARKFREQIGEIVKKTL
ncbi:MAG TPA: uracil-DNA glycosylase [Thermodesulfovibrionales bacterium]|nr:uracil-DNA glycosylase [Thermodesulfovibrionales bacterium]